MVPLSPQLPATTLAVESPHLGLIPLSEHPASAIRSIAASYSGLWLGTARLGVVRANRVPSARAWLRTSDLIQEASRLNVACVRDAMTPGHEECYVATGGAHAFRWDGQSFHPAEIDPEPGSRVLAVLSDPQGQVFALHRGPSDSHLRMSSVADTRWTPTSFQPIKVPHGPPDLSFASYGLDGNLWLGLRYTDKEGDAVDYGAAEINLSTGKVVYHGERGERVRGTMLLPDDTTGIYWRAADEAWFATRSGAARWQQGKLKVFTENDGLISEIIHDIGPGLSPDDVWIATKHGVGEFDGNRWVFPDTLPLKSDVNALGRDRAGRGYLGSTQGLYCLGRCAEQAINSKNGLMDDAVLALAIDLRDRVWILTKQGLSIVTP